MDSSSVLNDRSTWTRASIPFTLQREMAKISSNDKAELDLPCGPIIARQEDGIIYARGVKYAEANRFEKPRKLKPWKEPRDCTQPAVICPQNPSPLDIVNGPAQAGRIHDEDCLHVTVAAPYDAKNLPVMVYFHGGAFMIGGGDLDCYKPTALARRGVVVVNVTYRLGMFGYQPIPNLAPANLGLLDQIAALKWVQENVSAFGGDPGRVTIFGQSAGGSSSYCLLFADGVEDLFHRAIIQSAPFDFEVEANREKMVAEMGERAVSKVGSAESPVSVDEILKLEIELNELGHSITDTLCCFAPLFGQDPLPPLSKRTERLRKVAKRIPVLTGYTRDEGTVFSAVNPEHSAEWYSKIKFQNDADRFVEDISKVTGGSPSFQFIWAPKDNKWGAVHCLELPFLLGDREGWKDAPMLDGEDTPEILDRLSPEMKSLWVAFAGGADLGGEKFVLDENFRFQA